MTLKLTIPTLPVSWGEVFDKLSILDIKAEKIADAAKLANVAREREAILPVVAQLEPLTGELDALLRQLKQVNSSLWEVEDGKRDCERRQCFDAAFVALARRVYIENDQRAAIKRQINDLLGSAIVEEKAYRPY